MSHHSDKEDASTIEDDHDGNETMETSSAEGGKGGENVTTSEEEKKEGEKIVEKPSGDTAKDGVKKDYSNYPQKNISDPHDNDVLYGRGGGTNHHPGNKRYRKMVEDKKLDYVNSKRLDKPLVALEIIKAWRGQDPPGRFLKLDEKTGLWSDVGDKKAREKTSQALREKAPQIRKQQEEELYEEDDGPKTTRFAEGTKEGSNHNVRKPGLARDTSLGPLTAENVSALEGFSWQEGISSGDGDERPSPRNPEPAHSDPHSQPYPPAHSDPHSQPYPPPGYYPPQPGGPPPPPPDHYRYGSHGSIGSMGPPPSSSYPPRTTSEDRRMQYLSTSGRFDSWGSLPSHVVAPPGAPPHHRSGSWGPPDRSGSWGPPEHGGMASREHSLGQFPLSHASVAQPAPYNAFDGRNGSYGPAYPPPPPPSHYAPPPYHYPRPGPPPVSPSRYPPPHVHSGHYRTHSNPPLSVDPAVASAWSGRPEAEIVQTLSADEYEKSSKASSPTRGGAGHGSKPDIIKRHTSNQNETIETKPDRMGASVKRLALNRDSSNAANRLKELCFPGQFSNGKFDAAREVHELSEDMGRSRLSADYPGRRSIAEEDRTSTLDYLPPMEDEPGRPRPSTLEGGDRMTTVDLIAMDLAVKPKSMVPSSRSSTIEGLALDAVDEALLMRPEMERGTTIDLMWPGMERGTTMDFIMGDLEKPGTLGLDDRMTTTDFLEIVNEPIADDDPALFSGRRQVV